VLEGTGRDGGAGRHGRAIAMVGPREAGTLMERWFALQRESDGSI